MTTRADTTAGASSRRPRLILLPHRPDQNEYETAIAVAKPTDADGLTRGANTLIVHPM